MKKLNDFSTNSQHVTWWDRISVAYGEEEATWLEMGGVDERKGIAKLTQTFDLAPKTMLTVH